MAEVVLRQRAEDDPRLAGRLTVSSAGTANWHVGSSMDERARAALDRAGFSGAGTRGLFADTAYLHQQDVVVVMGVEHRRDVIQRLASTTTEVVTLRSLLGHGDDLDVADPYYGTDSDFDECLDVIRRGVEALAERLARRLGDVTSPS
jgi:protein-tyrosine phosphatase